jgi:hypothetical protein
MGAVAVGTVAIGFAALANRASEVFLPIEVPRPANVCPADPVRRRSPRRSS